MAAISAARSPFLLTSMSAFAVVAFTATEAGAAWSNVSNFHPTSLTYSDNTLGAAGVFATTSVGHADAAVYRISHVSRTSVQVWDTGARGWSIGTTAGALCALFVQKADLSVVQSDICLGSPDKPITGGPINSTYPLLNISGDGNSGFYALAASPSPNHALWHYDGTTWTHVANGLAQIATAWVTHYGAPAATLDLYGLDYGYDSGRQPLLYSIAANGSISNFGSGVSLLWSGTPGRWGLDTMKAVNMAGQLSQRGYYGTWGPMESTLPSGNPIASFVSDGASSTCWFALALDSQNNLYVDGNTSAGTCFIADTTMAL